MQTVLKIATFSVKPFFQFQVRGSWCYEVRFNFNCFYENSIWQKIGSVDSVYLLS